MLDIPLINDLLTTYNNVDINNYFDKNIIKMHNNILKNTDKEYTNQEIYDYIKFINYTGLDVNNYKNISKYININNFYYFEKLFENYDICCELFPLLSYDIVKNYNNLKNDNISSLFSRQMFEIWIYHNIKYVKRYNSKLLDPFLICKTTLNKYYMVNGKIFFIIDSNMKPLCDCIIFAKKRIIITI